MADDTDGDNVSDINDLDDDNDGYTDDDELTQNQSDPLDANSTPPDNDADMVSDLNDDDDDDDGMLDTWEDEHAELDPMLNDGEEDMDADGQSNCAECIAGSDPSTSDSVFSVVAVRRAGRSLVEFRVSWKAVPGRSYRVFWADSSEGPWHEIRELKPEDVSDDKTGVRTWTDRGTHPAMKWKKPGDCTSRFYKVAAYR